VSEQAAAALISDTQEIGRMLKGLVISLGVPSREPYSWNLDHAYDL